MGLLTSQAVSSGSPWERVLRGDRGATAASPGPFGEEAKGKQGQISGAPGRRSGCETAGRKEHGRGLVGVADQLTPLSTPSAGPAAPRRCQGPLHLLRDLRPTALATAGGDASLEFQLDLGVSLTHHTLSVEVSCGVPGPAGLRLPHTVSWWRTHGRYLLAWQTEFGSHPTRGWGTIG